MPELPEVEGLATWIGHRLTGREILDVRLRSVAALKTCDPPLAALRGLRVCGAARRGKYLAIQTGKLQLVTHFSLGGWLRWIDGAVSRKPSLRGPIIAEIIFDEGTLDLTEQGKEKRLAIWVVRDLNEVEQVSRLGPEALDPQLDAGMFRELLQARKGTVKSVLADQRVIAGIGNAYSDEILHAARLSPFLLVTRMTRQQSVDLYAAMRTVLGEAVSRATSLAAADLKKDKRATFRVHARTGQACPVCGDCIREVWMGSRALQYCPGCQTGGKVYKDRRLSRLLK